MFVLFYTVGVVLSSIKVLPQEDSTSTQAPEEPNYTEQIVSVGSADQSGFDVSQATLGVNFYVDENGQLIGRPELVLTGVGIHAPEESGADVLTAMMNDPDGALRDYDWAATSRAGHSPVPGISWLKTSYRLGTLPKETVQPTNDINNANEPLSFSHTVLQEQLDASGCTGPGICGLTLTFEINDTSRGYPELGHGHGPPWRRPAFYDAEDMINVRVENSEGSEAFLDVSSTALGGYSNYHAVVDRTKLFHNKAYRLAVGCGDNLGGINLPIIMTDFADYKGQAMEVIIKAREIGTDTWVTVTPQWGGNHYGSPPSNSLIDSNNVYTPESLADSTVRNQDMYLGISGGFQPNTEYSVEFQGMYGNDPAAVRFPEGLNTANAVRCEDEEEDECNSDDPPVTCPCLPDVPDPKCDPCNSDNPPDECDPCNSDNPPDTCPCLPDDPRPKCDPCNSDNPPDECDPCNSDNPPDTCPCLPDDPRPKCDPCNSDNPPDTCPGDEEPPPPPAPNPCSYGRGSRGTSLRGRSFPVYFRFRPPDRSRLYDVTIKVSGPGLSERTVYSVTNLKGPKRLHEANVPGASPGLHTYTWTVDWKFAVDTEISREAAWNSWRNQHQGWAVGDTPLGSEPADAGPEPFPKWKPPHRDLIAAYVPAVPSIPAIPPETEDTPAVSAVPAVYSDLHRHETAAWLAWWARKSAWASWAGGIPYDRPHEPGFANPMNMGSWPVDPGNPYLYNYSSSTRDDGDGATASYSESGTDGRFDQRFSQHPKAGVMKCLGQQLVVVPPTCSGVGGRNADVGEYKSTTYARYLNPNRPSVAVLQTRGISFTIPAANYHAAVPGNGAPRPMRPGTTTSFTGFPTRHNLPGNYSAGWSLYWYIHWGDSSGWPRDIDTVDTGTPVPCSGGPIQIFAEPPTCRVTRHEFEVNDSQTQIEIELTNPNRVPIAVDSATHTIDYFSDLGVAEPQSGSTIPALNTPGPRASIHNPRYSNPPGDHYPDTHPRYIPVNGTTTLSSTYHPYIHPNQYDYTWTINSFLGIESWNTSSSNSRAHPDRTAEYIHTPDGDSCATDTLRRHILRLAYLPYVKVYEGGVAAGGRFGTAIGYDACSAGSTIIGDDLSATAQGTVFGFRKDTNLASAGASSEYALRAFGQIHGYYSASQRNRSGQVGAGLDQPHLGLSFSNTDNLPHGGNYGLGTTDSFANRRCLAHYWATIALDHTRAQTSPVLTDSLDLSDPLVTRDSQLYRDGDLTLSATDDEQQLSTAIFTKGDLFITSDIYNNRDAIWQGGDRTQVGSIYLITKGNVYIDKDVTRIDAIIIALPPDNQPLAQGTVYTCSEGTTRRYRFSNHHTACLNPLTVNGAVIARAIVLGRTNGSRNLAQAFEHPEPYLQDYPQPPATDKVAEIFYFSPEYYISLPAASFIESQVDPNQYYRTDSIISLPPLF